MMTTRVLPPRSKYRSLTTTELIRREFDDGLISLQISHDIFLSDGLHKLRSLNVCLASIPHV